MVKEYGNAPAVPTGVLMEVLRQELQVRGAAGERWRQRRCCCCVAGEARWWPWLPLLS